MTVLQFRPRKAPEPKRPRLTNPVTAAKAWTCIVLGLYMAPLVFWLDLLSETIEEDE